MPYNNPILNQLAEIEGETDSISLFPNQNINAVKVACAMANTKGGIIIIGLDEKGEVTGISDEAAKNSIHEFSTKISPSLPFTYNILDENGKNVLIISIWEGANKPYSSDNRFYISSNGYVKLANAEDINSLFAERDKVENSWERMPNAKAIPNDLSNNVYNELKQQLIKLGKCSTDITLAKICRYMGFITDSSINNAGIVVMANNPSEFLPQTRIRVSMFGKKGNSDLINVRLFDGNLVESINEITEYITNLYPPKIEIVDNRRIEYEILPKVAFREGLLNAVVHRTYSPYESSVVIYLNADNVQIINSGELPKPIKVGDLKKKHQSILRNPDIANAFYILKYIEIAGSGTLRIINECTRNGCAQPIWSSENGFVSLTFPSVYHNQDALNSNNWYSYTANLSKDKSIAKTLGEILEYVSSHEISNLNELSNHIGKSYPTMKRYMQMLKDANLIRYEGSTRSGTWKLTI